MLFVGVDHLLIVDTSSNGWFFSIVMDCFGGRIQVMPKTWSVWPFWVDSPDSNGKDWGSPKRWPSNLDMYPCDPMLVASGDGVMEVCKYQYMCKIPCRIVSAIYAHCRLYALVLKESHTEFWSNDAFLRHFWCSLSITLLPVDRSIQISNPM